MEQLLRDLRVALRTLAKAPVFALVVIATIALGIGANVTIFTWVKAIALKPVPGVEGASQLVTLNGARDRRTGIANGFQEYTYIRDNAKVFQGVFAHELVTMSLSEQGRPEFVVGSVSSGNYFEVLGVHAALGRTFTPEEDLAPNANALAVLSHRIWQRRFSADPQIIGKTIRLNAHPFTVIGVLPAEFAGVYGGIAQDVWVPLQMQSKITKRDPDLSKTGRWFQIMARMKPGETVERAQSEISLLASQLEKADPQRNRDWKIIVYPLLKAQRGLQSTLAPVLLIVMTVVGLVLLIACANIASLLLTRAVGRQKEIAVRLALGASRWQISRQLLVESLLLSAVGGLAGLLVSAWTAHGLLTQFPLGEFHLNADLSVDGFVLLFTALASLLTGVIFGLAPAWQSTKTNIVETLKAEAGAISGGFRKSRMRNALVIAQIALSMVALVAAGLFLRAVQHSVNADPGFRTESALVATYDLSLGDYPNERGLAFHRQLLERAAALPGSQAAGITSFVPLGLAGGGAGFSAVVEGYVPRGQERAEQDIVGDMISPGFLKVLGIPLLAGREFTAQDTETSPPVVVINATFAQKYWPNQEALGHRVQIGGRWHEVVGVARDAKYRQFNEDPAPLMYFSVLQRYQASVTLVLRTTGDPGAAWPALQRAIQDLDPNLAVFMVKTLENHVASSFFPQRIAALLLAAFGGLALFLAAIGLYGLLSYAVSQRRRELGVRMALGASPQDILRLVTGQGIGLVAIGSGIGLVAAFAAARALESLLLGVSTSDPATFAGVALLLLSVGAVACLVPAWRAMRTDPMIALRNE